MVTRQTRREDNQSRRTMHTVPDGHKEGGSVQHATHQQVAKQYTPYKAYCFIIYCASTDYKDPILSRMPTSHKMTRSSKQTRKKTDRQTRLVMHTMPDGPKEGGSVQHATHQ